MSAIGKVIDLAAWRRKPPVPREWGSQQAKALEAIANWRANPGDKQVFRLFGYAGTGKSTLAKAAAEDETSPVFTAFTAKAATVMRDKGCDGARNIHQLLYSSKSGCGAVEQDVLVADNLFPPEPEQLNKRPQLTFKKNVRDPLKNASLLIIDEASMISDEVLADLLPLEIPILALGDPAQLSPVGNDRGKLTAGEPDAFLTEIHRQSLNNPIVQLSMLAREGQQIPWGAHGASQVIAAIAADVCNMPVDQIICGTNRTRRLINKRVRCNRGYTDWRPECGERLVCLKNQHNLGLLNGTIWICRGVQTGYGRNSRRPTIELELESEELDDLVTFNCPIDDFYQYFDFGYCLTVHKAQGGEWHSVALVDESYIFGNDANRWLYTGITRAAKQLILVRMRKGGWS